MSAHAASWSCRALEIVPRRRYVYDQFETWGDCGAYLHGAFFEATSTKQMRALSARADWDPVFGGNGDVLYH